MGYLDTQSAAGRMPAGAGLRQVRRGFRHTLLSHHSPNRYGQAAREDTCSSYRTAEHRDTGYRCPAFHSLDHFATRYAERNANHRAAAEPIAIYGIVSNLPTRGSMGVPV